MAILKSVAAIADEDTGALPVKEAWPAIEY